MPPRVLLILLFACASIGLRGQAVTTLAGSPFASSVWSGNVSPTSVTVAARLTASAQRVRLHVSTSPALTSPVHSSAVTTAAGSGNAVKLSVSSLQPDTDYFYGIEVAGVLRSEPESRGRFRTFPLGRASFKIAFGSCGDFRGPDQRVFDAILAERPLLFINTGDLHYSDINSTSIDDYRANYDAVLKQPQQAALYRGVPLAYMWDDHDFCGNDSNGNAVGRDTARNAYKERVPHYPIAAVGGPIAQVFTIGRVRFIMTDIRSGANDSAIKESASKTRMSAAQKAWFKQELISARDAGFPLIVWVNSNPWIDPAALGADSWAGWSTERTELANFIRDNRISNLAILAGDMHALAYDNGTNSDYATGGGAPIHVLHGAALTAGGSSKGGPYSGGVLPGNQQYGILEFYDSGGPSIACRFLGMRVGEGAKISTIFSTTTPTSSEQAIVNTSTLAHVAAGTDQISSGFVIAGKVPRTVLVRAVGPTLADFGLNDPLSSPQLSLYQGNRVIARSEGWAPDDDAEVRLTAAFDRAGAFRFASKTTLDAALLITLAPGVYTLQVKSGDGAGGATLVEIYDVP